MGLFDRFKKQDCEICGKEVGMFGYKKLEDGEICKDCVKLLSPWFEDRRHSTVAQIKEQLAYREQNAEELKNFHPTIVYGDSHRRMFVEERDGVPYRFCIANGEDYLDENADLVLVENIEEIIIDIQDNAHELLLHEEEKDEDGNIIQEEEYYDPPRYDYSYEFKATLLLKNIPWFDAMDIQLNRENPELFEVGDMGDADDAAAYARANPKEAFSEKFLKYKTWCDEIEALTKPRTAVPEQEAPKPKFCPNCGAPCEGGKFCQNCGSRL